MNRTIVNKHMSEMKFQFRHFSIENLELDKT